MADSKTSQRLAAVVQEHAILRPQVQIPLLTEAPQHHIERAIVLTDSCKLLNRLFEQGFSRD